MFTGIIEEVGEITSIKPISGGIRLTIAAYDVLSDLAVGDSISVEGVCQTVVRIASGQFDVEAVGETLEKTTLGDLTVGSKVNLERPLRPVDRLGGHFVQGHVNGTGKILQWYPRGENFYLEVEIPAALSRYAVLEGSIAIDGISLTIAHLEENRLGINIIPHTAAHTSLSSKKVGDKVNIEVDMLAKYIEKLILSEDTESLSMEKLKKWGFK